MGIGSTWYQLFLLLHVVTVVVAFGGNFVQPILARSGGVLPEQFARAALYVQLPAVLGVFVTGMGMIGLSDRTYRVSTPWVGLAIAVAVLAGALQWLVARGHRAKDSKHVSTYTALLHLMLVVGLYLMIWKPGT